MTRQHGKLGKLDAQVPRGLLDLTSYAALPPAPNHTVRGSAVWHTWSMAGNDRYGDCTLAAASHAITFWNSQTAETLPVPTEAQVVSEYFKLTGGADVGLVEANVLAAWMNGGLWGNKILGYAPVHDHSTLKQAVAFFGIAYIGVKCPANIFVQFDAGEPWTLTPTPQSIIGGHAVPIVGYDDRYVYVITWGRVQRATWAWLNAYMDEAWCIVPEAYALSAVGHLDLARLQADLSNV